MSFSRWVDKLWSIQTVEYYSVLRRSKWSSCEKTWRKLDCVFTQFSSFGQLCLTLCDPMDCSTPGFLVHHQLLELAQTHVHRVGDTIQPSHPLTSLSTPSFNLSLHQGLFQRVSWCPKYWSFSFSISSSNEYSGLISFRIDWLDLLAVQGTLKSLLQTTVQKHQFFGLSFLYSPTLTSIHDCWKNHNFD